MGSALGKVWQLGLDPPAGLTLSSNIRNRAKKARQQLRDKASNWFRSCPAKYGATDVQDVTDYQRGMVEGRFEWAVWTVEEREEELRKRAPVVEATGAEQVVAATATSSKKKGGKASKGQVAEEEDLDALLNEFGVTIEDK